MKLEPVRTLEPVAVVNSVVALAEALIGVAVGFGAAIEGSTNTPRWSRPKFSSVARATHGTEMT
jgi:hypothetical protein